MTLICVITHLCAHVFYHNEFVSRYYSYYGLVMADPKTKRQGMIDNVDSKMVSPETVKVVGESVGIIPLSDNVTTYVAEEVTFRLKEVLQVCYL